MSQVNFRFVFRFFVVALISLAAFNFTVTAQNQPAAPPQKQAQANVQIALDSPTATVLAFYKAMRERRFREAMMMTNLRAAVESLTAEEMKELSADFEPMAAQTPEKVETNGEQISAAAATVFVKNINPYTGEMKLDAVSLRKDNNGWTILSGDEATEMRVRSEGKDYFFKVRMETRHADVELTLQDIIQAQLKYSMQNAGAFTTLEALAKQRLIPAEIMNPEVMGYNFRLTLSKDARRYTVNAEPVTYGKTGKLSFVLASGEKGSPSIQQEDKAGAPLAAKN